MAHEPEHNMRNIASRHADVRRHASSLVIVLIVLVLPRLPAPSFIVSRRHSASLVEIRNRRTLCVTCIFSTERFALHPRPD
eukprot:5107736-Pyramimonas_sp.AAC.1